MPSDRQVAPRGSKHCRRCDATKPEADFAKGASKCDGLRVYCRDCDRARQKARYWTKDRRKAKAERLNAAKRRKLILEHGLPWVREREQEEQLLADERKAQRRAARRAAAVQQSLERTRAGIAEYNSDVELKRTEKELSGAVSKQ